MTDPFIGEIRIFAGNFPPRDWAFCDGQLLPISENTALFSILGTTYGGDGRTTFALPNLEGRAPMHPGRGPGLTARQLGQRTGAETVALAASQMPSHTHTLHGRVARGGQVNSPKGNTFANGRNVSPYSNETPNATANDNMLSSAGGSQAHNNMQPYLALNFIIALQGIYPTRS